MPRSSHRKASSTRKRRSIKRKSASLKKNRKRSRSKCRKSGKRYRKVKGGMDYDEGETLNVMSISKKPATFDALPLEVKDIILSQIVDSYDISNIEMKNLEALSSVFGIRGQLAESKIVNKLSKHYFPNSKYLEKTSIHFKKYNLRLLSTYYSSLIQFLNNPSNSDNVWVLYAKYKYPYPYNRFTDDVYIRICRLDNDQVRIQDEHYDDEVSTFDRGIDKPISDLNAIIDTIQSRLLEGHEPFNRGGPPTVFEYKISIKAGRYHIYNNYWLPYYDIYTSGNIPFTYTR